MSYDANRLCLAADAILVAIRKDGDKATVQQCASALPIHLRPVDAFTADELLAGMLFLERMGVVQKSDPSVTPG